MSSSPLILPLEKRLLGLILLGHCLLALAFSTGPLFEAPDEIEHFRYIRVLTRTSRLPDPAGQPQGQFHQPPLYYLLNAPLLALLDDSGFDDIDGRKNPFYGYRFDVPGSDNKNQYLHTRAEQFPYTDSPIARTVHLLRLVSVAMGLGTVWVTYRIACLVWTDSAALRLLTAGISAFTAQFIYLSGHLNNDNLLILLASAVLWWLLRYHRQPLTWRRSALLGVLVGLAVLTKSSGFFLVLPGLVALALNRQWWRWMPYTGGIALLVGGVYYLHNLVYYGDLTLMGAWQQTWASDVVNDGRFSLSVALENFPYVYNTVWARFGSGALTIGKFYNVFTIVMLGMGGGLVLRLRKRAPGQDRGIALITGGFILGWLLASFYLSGVAWAGNQGRYLLPGLAGWALLLVYGWSAWVPPARYGQLAGAGVIGMAAISVWLLVNIFLPAYRVERLPDTIEQPLDLRYDAAAELIGVSQATLVGQPGEVLTLRLYWRALAPVEDDLRVYLHTQNSDLIRRDSYPGTGMLLSTDWQTGNTWAETYLIDIPPDAPVQVTYPLTAGLYQAGSQTRLPVTNAAGDSVQPIIGRVVIPNPPEPQPELAYHFGSSIGLTPPQITTGPDAIEICLDWYALAPMPLDYHLFVHVLDENSRIIAQRDQPPLGGLYPTSVWQVGERVAECVRIETDPAAVAQVALGWYDVPTDTRLPVQDTTGIRLTDDRVLLSIP